jgi:ribosomal protein S12 methylthiotransferase
MLKRMKRGGSVASYHRLFDRLRTAMPDITIRTTFLVGFPGEDEAAFENLKSFVTTAQFDRLGVFDYSPEEGTPGFEMTPRVPKKIAASRRRELMALQQPISFAKNRELVGREIDVLVEGRKNNGDTLIARSWRDAPEIDGSVLVSGAAAAVPGEFLRVRVTGAQPYDLAAVPLHPAAVLAS